MAEKEIKPLIDVKKGGTNFKMEDCEFDMRESERPILETKADNTKIKGTKVTTSSSSTSGFWTNVSWKIIVPILVIVIGGIILKVLGAV